jgi:NitT/TauT family transport system permease protein
MSRSAVIGCRVAVVIAFLLAWEYLPKIDWLSEHWKFLNPFFISSPTQVAQQLYDLITGSNGSVSIWSYLRNTLVATLLGTAIGVLAGLLVGLLLSNSKPLAEVFGFFIVAANAVPRIALIPVIVLLFGVGLKTSIAAAVLVVFFLTFFNAFEGGRRVPVAMLENAQVMGASRLHVLRELRVPYVALWTFASLPNAISFGLIVVVATELLTGVKGVGQLMLVGSSTLNASLTFAVVVFLSVTGVALLTVAERAKRRILHWAEGI